MGLFAEKFSTLPKKMVLGQNTRTKREKRTRHTMYSSMSSIPSGGPPGGTHTQELWYSLRGIDAGLQSVLSADKCPCDACCVRVSKYYFAPEYWQKQTPNFSAKLKIFRRKDPWRKKNLVVTYLHYVLGFYKNYFSVVKMVLLYDLLKQTLTSQANAKGEERNNQ